MREEEQKQRPLPKLETFSEFAENYSDAYIPTDDLVSMYDFHKRASGH